ncbi:MAG: carbohydrate kinase [Candidatus Izimaplasma sp.]|nr:carbohydrate kinase [Candidatus Izimaplasma bacterium]
MIINRDKVYDILLVGEILIDIIESKTASNIVFGGSPANITINLKKLGFNPYLCATIGTDDYGTFLKNVLQAENVSLKFIRRVNQATSIVKLNQTKETPTPIFKRQADKEIRLSNKLMNHLKQSKILHFTFWPLSTNKTKKTIISLLNSAKENDVLVGFDPNFHPDLITTDISPLSIIEEIKDKIDIIKPSLDDSKRLFGKKLSKEDLMDKYESLNINLIILTLGKDGIFVSHNKKRFMLKTHAKEVIDATGAGDAFWSGLYAGILKNMSVKKSCLVGLKCSAHNLKQIGALSNLPTIEQIIKDQEEEQ